MKLDELDADALKRCCGSTAWVNGMLELRPFRDMDGLFAAADAVWNGLTPSEWLQAFSAHPKIGAKTSEKWSAGEQRGMDSANVETTQRMAEQNSEYERKFGWIFIVCATGKTADEMLANLTQRMHNDGETELKIAAAEQAKITKLRLEKLFTE
jgi:OHCU decarboxylase